MGKLMNLSGGVALFNFLDSMYLSIGWIFQAYGSDLWLHNRLRDGQRIKLG
jgi:hypothetical protein